MNRYLTAFKVVVRMMKLDDLDSSERYEQFEQFKAASPENERAIDTAVWTVLALLVLFACVLVALTITFIKGFVS